MPWKETNVLEERMKFIARYLEGEKISCLCREFGISRKTGHKIINRYETEGTEGLQSRSSIAIVNHKTTPLVVQKLILEVKKKYPSWGAPKIYEILKRRNSDIKILVISTIHAILEKHGLVKNRSHRTRYRAQGTNLKPTTAPNDLWCIDYKGQFLLGNQKYCYPLTISDHFSRYLLGCEAVSGTKTDEAFSIFENTFKNYGLPLAIRSDNGVPFSARALFGLSRLSVWWLRLGIKLERIEPGHPEQNGRHERMHRTLKLEVPKKSNFLQQQEAFDEFVLRYNTIRPHEALGMKTPSEVYQNSAREFPRYLTELQYPGAHRIGYVCKTGTFSFGTKAGKQQRIFLSESLWGQQIGVYAQEEHVWSVKFMDYDLGFFDDKSLRFTPAENPFINPMQKLLPERSE